MVIFQIRSNKKSKLEYHEDQQAEVQKDLQ